MTRWGSGDGAGSRPAPLLGIERVAANALEVREYTIRRERSNPNAATLPIGEAQLVDAGPDYAGRADVAELPGPLGGAAVIVSIGRGTAPSVRDFLPLLGADRDWPVVPANAKQAHD